MEQPPLFFEYIYDALRHLVQAAGGAKAVGARIYPNKEQPDAAGRYLMDALNHSRPEKLGPEELLALLRIGHEYGCHVAMHYITRAAGYTTPEPVTPEDERSELQREFVTAVSHLRQLAARIEANS